MFLSGGTFKNLAIELFATDNQCYVFDANQVVFLDVDERVFAILQQLRDEDLSAAEIISRLDQYSESDLRSGLEEISRLQERGYLLNGQTTRHSPLSRKDFEETLTNRMGGFTVYSTTKCNLACSYCIYGGEYHRHPELSQATMTWETARNMADFLVKHSRKSKEIRLDWFGGEPLLAFDLIKRTVEYLKASTSLEGPAVRITIASNGTVLTDALLDFLLEHKVYLQFSIDGEKAIHDRERRFRNGGNSSYDLILRNLQRVYDRDPNYFQECMSIKCVITMEALSHSDDGFWMHPLINILQQDRNVSLLIQEPHFDVELDKDYFDQLNKLGQKLVRHASIGTLEELTQELNWREQAFFDQTFGQFIEVQGINQLLFGAKKIGFAKGCLMGIQEGAVLTSGDIVICHKASSFEIGNVNQGDWDFDRIWQWHERLYKGTSECSSCIAARFCELCYEKLDGSDDTSGTSLANYCGYTRHKYHLIFGYMLQVLDRNPNLWADMKVFLQSKVDSKLTKMKLARQNTGSQL